MYRNPIIILKALLPISLSSHKCWPILGAYTWSYIPSVFLFLISYFIKSYIIMCSIFFPVL